MNALYMYSTTHPRAEPEPSLNRSLEGEQPSMETHLTKLLDMEAPIMVAGMAPTTGPELAAVSPEAHPLPTARGCPPPRPTGAAAVD